MERSFLDPKVTGKNCDARRDDKTVQGAAIKSKGGCKRRSRERKQGIYTQFAFSKDRVRKVTRAALSTMKIQDRKRKRKKSNTTSFTRPKRIFQRNTAKVPRAKDHKASARPAKEARHLARSSCRESARILLVIVGILLQIRRKLPFSHISKTRRVQE